MQDDLLNEDRPINGQKWVCLSFLSPEGVKGCKIHGLKVRGSYENKEDADKQAKRLSELDPDFDVFVGEVGKWLPWSPDPNSIEDQVYAEKELNELMKGYKDNLFEAKKLEEQRKRDLRTEKPSKENKTKERLKQKLEKNKSDKNKISDEEKEKLKHDDELIKEKIKQADIIKKELNAEKTELSNYDKIKKLYDEIKKK